MLTDVPNTDDFADAGVEFLNLAWGGVLTILLDLAETREGAKEYLEAVGDEIFGQVEENAYWKAANRELGMAVSLTQQGAEFLLKAGICHVSPWLLILQKPADFPKKCDAEDVPFQDFRTLDAQDLVKVFDTFSDKRLPDSFVSHFETLRKLRNRLTHSVDRNLTHTATGVLDQILQVSEVLIGKEAWPSVRRMYLKHSRHAAIEDATDATMILMAREFSLVCDLLEPSKLRRYFGFDSKQRRYLCYNCGLLDESGCARFKTAQLRPNTPESTVVHCFVCGVDEVVERRDCGSKDCKGNVIGTASGEGICLTCAETSIAGEAAGQ